MSLMPDRRIAIMGAASALLSISPLRANNFPSRPIRLTIPFPPGSASDVVGRIVADRAAQTLGQPFVIENQAGAGGNVGTRQFKGAEPDGHRLLISTSGPLAVNVSLTTTLGYDPSLDFEPITKLATLPNIVVVGRNSPFRTLQELVDHTRRNAASMTYSSTGIGTSQHVGGLLFEQLLGVRMTHVAYSQASPLVTDLMSGTVPVSFQLIPAILGQVRSGDVRVLAIASASRSPSLPEVPTAADAGLPGVDSSGWFALLAPKGTPAPIVEQVRAAVVGAINDPATKARLVEVGADPSTSTPSELATFIAAETLKWRDVIRRGGIAAQ
jgi:tripartite-type tricarboxylate transporter receptor subunit TctC